MKIHITKMKSHVWRWELIGDGEVKYGGYCNTKADAQNDASITLTDIQARDKRARKNSPKTCAGAYILVPDVTRDNLPNIIYRRAGFPHTNKIECQSWRDATEKVRALKSQGLIAL